MAIVSNFRSTAVNISDPRILILSLIEGIVYVAHIIIKISGNYSKKQIYELSGIKCTKEPNELRMPRCRKRQFNNNK